MNEEENPALSGENTLTLIGESADFKRPSSGEGPRWEHMVLRENDSCKPIAVDQYASPAGHLLRNRYVDLGQIYRLGRALRGSRCVLAQSEQSGYQALIAMRMRSSKTPLFIIFHGHRWWTRRNRAFASLARRSRNVRFLALSESLRAMLIEVYGFRPEQVITTGFGADARFFTPAEPSSDAMRCVVSAGTASRDYRTLIAASRGLQIGVEIAADSTWYREELNIAPDEPPGNVRVFSAGGYLALRDLYARALFVVVPLLDVRYACGYAVIAEAMAMGRAVIVTRTSAPSDLVEEGVTGLYVPPNDPPSLQAAMKRLLDDPALARRMGAAARTAVERMFNVDAYVERLQDAMGGSIELRSARGRFDS